MVIFLYFIILLAVTIYSIRLVGSKQPGYIRIVWYLFSLAVVLSSIVFLWAVNVGAINQEGEYNGDTGAVLKSVIEFVLDLNKDFVVLNVVLALILLPQFISYTLSGLTGHATSPSLVKEAVSFWSWGLVKSLAVVSGVFFTLSMSGVLLNWSGWHAPLIMSAMLIMLSFSVLLVYLETQTMLDDLNRLFPRLMGSLGKVHQLFTRNS